MSIEPLGNGSMVYEGCLGLLIDGKQCTLGKEARVDQRADSTLPDRRSRQRDGHVYAPIGASVMMYNFVIEVDNIEMDVYNKPGAQLIGFSGSDWGQLYRCNRGVPPDVLHRIQR